jgi:tetratricopeptide (TPR) repeat protein
MNELPPPAASASEALKASIAVPRVSLREAGEIQVTPVHRPPAPLMAPGGGGKATWPERIGPYQVAGEIARGGMGLILKARDIDLGRDVAVKVLHAEHRDKPDVLRRFIEEAQIGSQLQHPGLVPVHGMGMMPDGLPYFVMKLVKGRTLAAILEERREPGDDRLRLLGIFEQVCQTVAYAHARRVVHRDLKPSNVMVGAFGEVQVMDWGLAKVLPREGAPARPEAPRPADVSVISTVRSGSGSSQSLAGSVLGTPAYMAPEQARGELEQVDARSDVFGLGAILCEVLTGMPPYTGVTLDEIYQKAKKGYLDEAQARLKGSKAAPELVDLALRCLEFEPRKRPADASGVAREVKSHLDSLEEGTRRLAVEAAEVRARAREERRSRRLTAVLFGAVLTLMAAAGVSWAAMERQAERRAGQAAAMSHQGLAEAERLLGEARSGGGQDLARWQTALASSREADRRSREVAPGSRGGAAAIERAGALLASVEAEAAGARAAAERAEKNRRMAARLQDLRVRSHSEKSVEIHTEFRRAFQGYGIDVEGLPAAEAARRIQESGIGLDLSMALMAWSQMKSGFFGEASAGARKLFEAAQAADPDPFRCGLRKASLGARFADMADMSRLAADALGKDLPPATVEVLAISLMENDYHDLAQQFLLDRLRRSPGEPAVHILLRKPRDWQRFAPAHQIAALSLLPRNARLLRDFYQFGSDWKISPRPWSEEAVRLRPSQDLPLGEVALLLGREGAIVAGLDLIDLALRRRPDNHHLHNIKGILLQEGLKDMAGAAEEYRESIRIQRLGVTLSNLGGSLKRLGDLEGAFAANLEALRFGEFNPKGESTLHNEVAQVLRARRDLDGAAYHSRKAEETAPRDRWAWYVLGAILAEQGKAAEALGQFQRAVEIDITSGESAIELLQFMDRFHLPARDDPAFPATERALRSFIDSLEGVFLSGVPFPNPMCGVILEAHEAWLDSRPAGEALEAARRIAGRRKGMMIFLRALIARELWRSGERREGLELMEMEARTSDHPPHIASRLLAMREEVRPDLLTFASIDAALADPVPILREGERWRFFRGKREPSAGLQWAQPGFDDSSWEEGPGGFGYADGDDATVLDDMVGRYTTVYIRRVLSVPPGGPDRKFELRVRSDDGFIAYVNGQEAGRFRAGLPGLRRSCTATASQSHEGAIMLPDILEITRFLRPGENLLALQGLNESLGSTDFSLAPEVYLVPGNDPERDRQVLESFRPVAKGSDAPARLAYLEGRIHQRAGRSAEALAAFERAAVAGPEPEPLERIAEVLEALGRKNEMGERMSAAFQAGGFASGKLLERWMAFEAAAGRSWASSAAAWPRRADPYEVELSPKFARWRFTEGRPPEGWSRPEFDDSAWREGPATFGNNLPHKVEVMSSWTTPDIWIRRRFQVDLPAQFPDHLRFKLRMSVLHDDDAEMSLNGEELARFKGWSQTFYLVRTRPGLAPLRAGENVLAVHCHDNGVGSQIDAGLSLMILTED